MLWSPDLICRNILPSDLSTIEELNGKQEFRISDIDNCIIDKIILKDEKAVAYGIVKQFAEGILLVNPDFPKVTRMKALNMLMEHAIEGSRKAGLTQLHYFVSDPRLAEMFKKHYDFQEAKDIILVRNL
jgi:hypothetical protein